MRCSVDSASYTYVLTPHLLLDRISTATLLIHKPAASINSHEALEGQLQVVNLPGLHPRDTLYNAQNSGASPFGQLHSVLHSAIGSYLGALGKHQESTAAASAGYEPEHRTGLPNLQKKLAEVELGLLQLQHNAEIPQVFLSIHPAIRDVLAAADRKNTAPSINLLDPTILKDSSFHNNLGATTNTWITEIQLLRNATRNARAGTALQEIRFWQDMEAALEDVEDRFRAPGVQLTLQVLDYARRRMQADNLRVEALEVKKTVESVKQYNFLLKDIPLDEMLSAANLDKMQSSLDSVFSHINRRFRNSNYPVDRGLALIEAISADMNLGFQGLVNGRTLMRCSMPDFESIVNAAGALWLVWDEQVRMFTDIAREVTRKRNQKFVFIKVEERHAPTKSRLIYIRNFRESHRLFESTLEVALGRDFKTQTSKDVNLPNVAVQALNDLDAAKELRAAYAAVTDADVLDLSEEGTRKWNEAENIYNDIVTNVEHKIVSCLRSQLTAAQDARGMFAVFSRFSEMLGRQNIRGAISDYQMELLNYVKNDISTLQNRLHIKYEHDHAYNMAELHDLPTVSGSIIWARQMERRLDTSTKRIVDVLGDQWHMHSEGQLLNEEIRSLRNGLDTTVVFKNWVEEVQARNNQTRGPLLLMRRVRSIEDTPELAVNFDPRAITLFKEVRNLAWLELEVPNDVYLASIRAKWLYPLAMSLIDSTKALTQITESLGTAVDISYLLNQETRKVQEVIELGLRLQWDSGRQAHDEYRVHPDEQMKFTVDFAASISRLQRKVAIVLETRTTLRRCLTTLQTCTYDTKVFQAEVAIIQALADRLSLEGLVNQPVWVYKTNCSIRSILAERLDDAIDAWLDAFQGPPSREADRDTFDLRANEAENIIDRYKPVFEPLSFEIAMRNNTIYVEPPLEFARNAWISHFHDYLSVVCGLECVRSSRFGFSQNNLGDPSCMQAYDLLHISSSKVKLAYDNIHSAFHQLFEYAEQWLQYQSLWDLQASTVYDDLGTDIDRWLDILHEIRNERSTFDTAETMRSFGWTTIDYRQVQHKIHKKYDDWQVNFDEKFAAQLGPLIHSTVDQMNATRKSLEGLSIETSSTTEAVGFISTVQTAKRKVAKWSTDLEDLRRGQAILASNRHHFPPDWLRAEHVDHAFTALNEIFERKLASITRQITPLRLRLAAQEGVLNRRVDDAIANWTKNRPISGEIPAEYATRMLVQAELTIESLAEEMSQIQKAKEALSLPVTSFNTLASILEEIQDFKAVYASLSIFWKEIDSLRSTKWLDVQPRTLRKSLEALLTESKSLPTRMRQYAAFEQMQNVLVAHMKVNTLLADLKSEAIQDRHWVQLYKTLGIKRMVPAKGLSLGDVWDLPLSAHESQLRDIGAQAQGELNLEEYLKQVRDIWQNYTLELVNYQGRCRLIRGWEELFSKCGENLSALQTMRHSPYYKIFEAEALSWEDKLNTVHFVYDIWVEVQRQWVHMEGIFSGNTDIKHLLPLESSRFQTIDSEFLALTRKVQRSPYVLEVIKIPGLQKSLERLAELLHRVQKALGEYLEKERAQFPRFFFVGDDDLLDILSKGQDVMSVARHLKKMFAGISGLTTDEPGNIVSFSSVQGEVVELDSPISLSKTSRVSEWLCELQSRMQSTLGNLLGRAVLHFAAVFEDDKVVVQSSIFDEFVTHYPTQIIVLASQVWWTQSVEEALRGPKSFSLSLERTQGLLRHLTGLVVHTIDPLQRGRYEQLITELVFQRNIVESLVHYKVIDISDHRWQLQLRHYLLPGVEPAASLNVKMATATFAYGFEYLGVTDRLVRTPLTERCFLTMLQALSQQLGGSPYGPAGTGKTETVKALGAQLGRHTIVFCCDDTFDYLSLERIFLGICQVGAWGCFDEFNRLEERILSAVSQQIQNIQSAMKVLSHSPQHVVELSGRKATLSPNTGLFVTMNPDYAGRSNLPDNLKKLFRSIAMSKPDKELIAEVTLYTQGFESARGISTSIVPVFDACASRMSQQAHYDFGLRALKSVLISCGRLKRAQLKADALSETSPMVTEHEVILQSLREMVDPKLVDSDLIVLRDIEKEFFPSVIYVPAPLDAVRIAVKNVANAKNLVCSEGWLIKNLQLFQIQQLHHGIMMVGASGTGKTATWTSLLEALRLVDGVEGISYIIDPKVISKDVLYGHLDTTTREWTDGIFTGILRKIIENIRGEESRRHWIVFDGDVDPEWIENLNSVLDDNKMLTLPNGERLAVPPNVRILFEVDSLQYATPATVSRCGMIWFNGDNVDAEKMVHTYLAGLKSLVKVPGFDDAENSETSRAQDAAMQVRIADELRRILLTDRLLPYALELASECAHIMTFSHVRALQTLFSHLNQAYKQVLHHQSQHSDFELESSLIDSFVQKTLLLAIIWSFVGDCTLADREIFGRKLVQRASTDIPNVDEASLIDFDVRLPKASWSPWQNRVPTVDLNTHSIERTDIVIPTVDTTRLEAVIYNLLAEHKFLILCGPPGSGKTMTLFSALRKLPEIDVVGLNFSSATTPDLVLRTFESHCEYKRTTRGVVLSPTLLGRRVVFFCDEINLPAQDRYGTQRVTAFMRQMITQNGFWRPSDKVWVSLERVQFVGACNPPTDAGRVPLGSRFLRHAPLIMVDYPGKISLSQIYGTMVLAVLKVMPHLRGYATALTEAMIDVYLQSQARLTQDVQSHYIYSPRELTRWVKGIYEAIKPLEYMDLNALVRLWVHEALRLFHDRLVHDDERLWTIGMITTTAHKHFPTIDAGQALSPPFLYSNWLTRHYLPVSQSELRDFVRARLRTFCEEEVDVPLVLYDDALDHVLRIDRVFRQAQGHAILIGTSGSGKTTLSRFVAWMNGLTIFQIQVHRKYTTNDFDEDLRGVLRRCGCNGEKICFLLDEANILDSAFLERMNTLLANGQVPGLFEGDEAAALWTACREGSQRQGLILDSQEELSTWFTQQIVTNLHVVFTMNPPQAGLSGRAATSPALFNRCVINWLGDWSEDSLYQVASELTQSLDLETTAQHVPRSPSKIGSSMPQRELVIRSMVYIHSTILSLSVALRMGQNQTAHITPRHFLDFVAQFSTLCTEKRDQLQEQQRYLNTGLDKLKETVDKVRDFRKSLAGKKIDLELKDREANEKLRGMVVDQQQAERRKAASYEVQAAIEHQEIEVAKRKERVLQDLANVEPAVLSAKESVQNIKKQQLTEVRSMSNPPAGVKLALESVCVLLGHKVDSWKTIQSIIRRDDFIASIVNYDNEQHMTASHRQRMYDEYLSREEYTYERVNRASKACGPLVQWVQAQVHFSEILDRVGPLREEVAVLEDQALQSRAEAKAIEMNITDIEARIQNYKSEYAALISQTQAIKDEMANVGKKIERSLHLMDSLAGERRRWTEGSRSFDMQNCTLIGDALVAAGMLAYAGPFDEHQRSRMADGWTKHLVSIGVKLTPNMPMIAISSDMDERVEWSQRGLPGDDLSIENAIMLKRHNRYPLIVDPSGKIVEFVKHLNKVAPRLTVTSFLDDNFTKQLEAALRFGSAILIQDAESFDPVLNPILNREYQRTGGRILVRLGRQDIDFSPNFKLFLASKNSTTHYAPDICSRVTLVNFSVTQSGLQSQSLAKVLKSERPDIDEQRSDFLKAQGEFDVHLRRLQRQLLTVISESEGNLLDNDTVVQKLEKVKTEAAAISAKTAEAHGVMSQIHTITQQYELVARSCTIIYAILSQMSRINRLYQFTLPYFVTVFEGVLASFRSNTIVTDQKERIDAIVRALFIATYRQISLSLFACDRLIMALLFIKAVSRELDIELLNVLLEPMDANMFNKVEYLVDRAGELSAFGSADMEEADWSELLQHDNADEHMSPCVRAASDGINGELRALLVLKILRPDRLIPGAEKLVAKVFGDTIYKDSDHLSLIVAQLSPITPLALCSTPGFDASYLIDNLAASTKEPCASIAMGSPESQTAANAAIAHAAATGTWALIKNVHLALDWLQALEKALDLLKPSPRFRLFLSMECTPSLPLSIFRLSRTLVCEQPAGLRGALKETMSPPAAQTAALRAPVERARLHVLLVLLHAVVVGRLRHAPRLGWRAAWAFNASDADCARHAADACLDAVAGAREHVAPSDMPWPLLRTLVVVAYAGKINDERDCALLERMAAALLTPAAFDEGFDVARALAGLEEDGVAEPPAEVGHVGGLVLPATTRWRDFEAWVDSLPAREPPTWLGLPADAERVLLEGLGRHVLDGMRTVDVLLAWNTGLVGGTEDGA